MASKLSKIPKVNHAAGIYADISVDGPIIGTLVAVVDRAKNLPNRKTMGKQNPYCAARLGKEAKKTETDWRGGQTPKWDQELRFTVHESPDYFKLKVSVFNDDKKTDLIGETWVDLKDLIIPGGSQGDHWHPLQCRGKYAGEVRIEMTYYDTRPEDEAVIERRKGAPEKIQEKPDGPNMVSSSLSGPRQLNDMKRRPLPTDPTGSQHVRPPRPEKIAPAPAAPTPARQFEQAHFPPAPGNPMYPRQPDRQFDMAYTTHAPHPTRTYETPDDFHRRDQIPQPQPGNFHYPQGHSYGEQPGPYDVPPRQPHQAYDMPMDYHRNMIPPRPDHVEGADIHGRMAYEVHPNPGYQYSAAPEQHSQIPYGHAGPSRGTSEPPSYVRPAEHERDRPHSQHGNAGRNPHNEIHREHFPEYAAMQPRVEDEEEEGPPPPPVHRSGIVQPRQMPPSYQAYTPDQRPRSSHSSNSQGNKRFPDAPQASGNVPASLVAGYDPTIAEDEAERAAYESRMVRRNSRLVEEAPVPYPEPLSYAPPYPAEQPSQSVDEQRKSLGSRGSAHSGSRAVHRKSVSPHPRHSTERESSIPFSPDSFDVLNPNAARSAVTRDPKPAYDTPAEAREAARRSEAEARRDPGPIVGDDGREIDPSDHLPTETWAPEPERKGRKPEVIIRFKNSKANANPRDPRAGQRGGHKPHSSESSSGWRRPPHVADTQAQTPPRSREGYGRGYNAPRTNSAYRVSVSPARSPTSLYAPSTGPPIPTKVPIAQPANQGHAAAPNNPGMDALSRELKSIDIGSVGCSPGRGRRYVPSSATGYAI